MNLLFEQVSLTLAHFLWQGALIALAAAIVLRRLARASAQARYAVACAALALMGLAPAATFLMTSSAAQSPALPALQSLAGLSATIRVTVEPGASPEWAAWIVLFWLAGVVVCSIRLSAGWALTQRLVASADPVLSSTLDATFTRFASRLAVTRPVRLLTSARISTPLTIGWLRPVVLLPASALTGLDPEQLHALLAHELAHILRHDFLVNLGQRFVETLLFFHPAVWWLSARIRAEREHCCDDLAVELCGDKLLYARALVELERTRSLEPHFALAATGSDLTARIHRILGDRSAHHDWLEPAAVVTAIVSLLIVAACHNTSAAQAPPAPPAPPARAAAPQPPTPPTPPAQAVVPVPPVPPAPPSVNRFRRDNDEAWVLFHGTQTSMNGSAADEVEARAARRSVSGDLLWFRRSASTYILQDAAALDRIAKLWAPMEALGEEQRRLGEQQRLLGEEQRKLGESMRLVRVQAPNLDADLDRIRVQLRSAGTQEELGRLQALIGELQSRIGALQGRAGTEQGRLGAQQGELGKRQGELGARQGALGKQQGVFAEQAERELRQIINEAISSGRAKPAP